MNWIETIRRLFAWRRYVNTRIIRGENIPPPNWACKRNGRDVW